MVDMLFVEFQSDAARRVINATAVPDDLLLETAGEKVVETESNAIKVPTGLVKEVGHAVDALLAAAQSSDGNVVRQRLDIERIPVCCVDFGAAKGGAGKLWVYGTPPQVHAPDVPTRWLGWLRREHR
jgi:hypothetical protein